MREFSLNVLTPNTISRIFSLACARTAALRAASRLEKSPVQSDRLSASRNLSLAPVMGGFGGRRDHDRQVPDGAWSRVAAGRRRLRDPWCRASPPAAAVARSFGVARHRCKAAVARPSGVARRPLQRWLRDLQYDSGTMEPENPGGTEPPARAARERGTGPNTRSCLIEHQAGSGPKSPAPHRVDKRPGARGYASTRWRKPAPQARPHAPRLPVFIGRRRPHHGRRGPVRTGARA